LQEQGDILLRQHHQLFFSHRLEGDTRMLVFSAGHYSSGVPDSWQAKPDREGVDILEFYQASKAVAQLKEQIEQHKQDGDIIVLSILGWKLVL